jgi:hypothetical protein
MTSTLEQTAVFGRQFPKNPWAFVAVATTGNRQLSDAQGEIRTGLRSIAREGPEYPVSGRTFAGLA